MYIGTVECDPGICATRNVHKRSDKDIQALHKGWEATPAHFNKVDFSSFLQDEAIEHFDMADAENDSKDTEKDSITGPIKAVEGSNDELEIGDDKPVITTTEQNEVRREVTDIKIFCWRVFFDFQAVNNTTFTRKQIFIISCKV